MTKRIILWIASLAVVIGLVNSGTSGAWFVNSVQRSQSITVSVVNNSYSANLADLNSQDKVIVMQGDNLVTLDGSSAVLELANESTTDTQIRISVEYTSYRNGAAEQVIYSGSEEDDIVVEFAPGKWAKNINVGGNCYYYYMGDAENSGTVSDLNTVPPVAPGSGKISAISSIYYKDSISYAYSGQKISVKVKFESKQADNVTWSTIDSYDVSGAAK